MMKYFLFLLSMLLCSAAVQAQSITTDTVQAKALFSQGRTLERKSIYDSALLLYRQSLLIYKRHKLWEGYYTTRNREVWCLKSLGLTDSAQSLCEYNLQQAEEKLPKLSEAKAILINTLGVLYNDYSLYNKALEFYQKSLDIKLKLFGEKHSSVSDTYNNMAIVYQNKFQYEKALDYYLKTLDIDLELLGRKHIYVSSTYNNMAVVYHKLGRYEEELECYQKSLSIFLELLGEKHPYVAAAYINMANLFHGLKKYEKALEFHEKGLLINTSLFGEKHTAVALSYHNIGALYAYKLEYGKAMEHYQKSLDIRLELLGEKSKDVSMTYSSLAFLYRKLQDYDSAVYFHHKAVKALAQGFESDDPAKNPKPEQVLEVNDMTNKLRDKGEILAYIGKKKEALQTYEAATACIEQAMREASYTEDKYTIATRAYTVYIRAALLHFLQKDK